MQDKDGSRIQEITKEGRTQGGKDKETGRVQGRKLTRKEGHKRQEQRYKEGIQMLKRKEGMKYGRKDMKGSRKQKESNSIKKTDKELKQEEKNEIDKE